MDKLEVSGVYKILCLVNGKFYIGSSDKIKKYVKNYRKNRKRTG